MSRIRLWSGTEQHSVVVTARTSDGTLFEVSNRRVYCHLLVGRDPVKHTAIVDTGAPTTVFPFRVWQRFPDDIRWLKFTDGSATKPGTLGGVSYQYKLGRVLVRLAGRDYTPTFPPVDVIAQFEQLDPMKAPNERLTRALVGLQLGPLEGRFLVVRPRRDLAERCEAWIADERPVDPLVLTSATL